MGLSTNLHSLHLRSTFFTGLRPCPSPIPSNFIKLSSISNPRRDISTIRAQVSTISLETSVKERQDEIESLFSKQTSEQDSDRKRNGKNSKNGASGVSSGVKLENIRKSYKGVTVLKDVTWEVKRGEKVGLVGVNGAGKTTQLRIITGQEEPDSGNVIKAKPNMKIAFLSQEFEVSMSKTVKEEFMSAFKEEMEITEKLEKVQKAIAEASTAVASNSKKQKSKPSCNAGSGSKAMPSPLKSETRVADLIKVETGAVVPCFYIYTKEDTPSKEVDRFSANYSSLSVKDREAGSNDESESEEKWEDEKYEYDKALNADRTYLKFKKRLDANPEQCFRYSYGGKPLLAMEDLKSPDKCGNCNSPRLFEMQLMPPLIYFLHEAVVDKGLKQSLDNWDWMTLIVYTCSKSCANAVNGSTGSLLKSV